MRARARKKWAEPKPRPNLIDPIRRSHAGEPDTLPDGLVDDFAPTFHHADSAAALAVQFAAGQILALVRDAVNLARVIAIFDGNLDDRTMTAPVILARLVFIRRFDGPIAARERLRQRNLANLIREEIILHSDPAATFRTKGPTQVAPDYPL